MSQVPPQSQPQGDNQSFGQIPSMAPPQPQVIPTAHEIQEDTNCLACGYNLRGLRSDGRCPECGTAVGRSLHGNFLRFAQPAYVRKLASGVTLILWGLLISVLVGLLAGALTATGARPELGQVLALLGGLVGLIGTWQVTSPDPSQLDAQWELSARKLVRIAVLVGLGAHVVQLINASPSIAVSNIVRYALAALLLAFGIVQLVGWFAQFVYFGKLAMRIPDAALARSTRTVMWGVVISMGVVLLAGVVALLSVAGGSRPGAGLAGVGVLACVAVVGMLVFGIWWLVLLFRYRRSFLDQAVRAEGSWYAQPVTGAAPPEPPTIGG